MGLDGAGNLVEAPGAGCTAVVAVVRTLSRQPCLPMALVTPRTPMPSAAKATLFPLPPPLTAPAMQLRGSCLYIANAGDSRCVLCRQGGVAEPLSRVRRPSLFCASLHTSAALTLSACVALALI